MNNSKTISIVNKMVKPRVVRFDKTRELDSYRLKEKRGPLKKRIPPSRVLACREENSEMMLNNIKQRLDYNIRRTDIYTDPKNGQYVHCSRNKNPYEAINVFDLLSSPKIDPKIFSILKRPVGVIALSQENIADSRVWSYLATMHDGEDIELEDIELRNIVRDKERCRFLIAESISKLCWLQNEKRLLIGDVSGQNMIVNKRNGFMFKSAGQLEAIEDGDHSSAVSEMILFICSLEKNGIINPIEIPSVVKYYLELEEKNYILAREYLKSVNVDKDELSDNESIAKKLANRTMYMRMLYYSN